MKLFILIIFLVAIVAFVISRALRSQKIIKQLRADRGELITEKSGQSDQLRLKGIEIEGLKKELDKYSEVEIKVELTGHEKRMLLNALEAPYYKSLVQNPKTKFVVREIHRNLKKKIKESMKE